MVLVLQQSFENHSIVAEVIFANIYQLPSCFLIDSQNLEAVKYICFLRRRKKSTQRGENHYRSEHIESFSYHQSVLRREFYASMKKKVYKITVSLHQIRAIDRVIVAEVIFANIYQLPSCFLIYCQNLESVKYDVFDFIDFLHQVKQAKSYFAQKSFRSWFI